MTGTKCEACGVGWLVQYSRATKGNVVVRYFRCFSCGHRPAENTTTSVETARRSRTLLASSKTHFATT